MAATILLTLVSGNCRSDKQDTIFPTSGGSGGILFISRNQEDPPTQRHWNFICVEHFFCCKIFL